MVGDGVDWSLRRDNTRSETLLRRSSSGMCNEGETVPPMSVTRESKSRRSKRRRRVHLKTSTIVCAVLAGSIQTSMAACISLQGSTACPAFNASSISNDDANIGLFPFLADVTNLNSFDSGLRSYIANGYAQIKYVSAPRTCLAPLLTACQISAASRLL